jgi:hypothetical protein
MKLIHRFWNGNKNGPLGTYPQRTKQLEKGPDGPLWRRHPRAQRQGSYSLGPLYRTQHRLCRRRRPRPHHRLRFQPQSLFPEHGRARRVASGAAVVQPDRRFR